MNYKRLNFILTVLAAAWCGGLFDANAGTMGTAFTYQGRLVTPSGPANGTYELVFRLYDAPAGGTEIGVTPQPYWINVASGVFTVTIDFGDVFHGDTSYLEIMARTNGAATFTTLPRQPLTPSPNALNALGVAGGQQPDNTTPGRTVTVLGGHASSNGVPFVAQGGGNLVLQAGNGFDLDFIDPNYHGGHVIIRSGANWIQATDPLSDGGDIVFQTGGPHDTFIERARLLGRNGYLGINKLNPATVLDVNGTVTATAFAGSGAGLTGITIPDGSVTSVKLAPDRLSLSKVSGGGMFIDPAGNLGIGTSSPSTRLVVMNTEAPTVILESSSSIGTWLRLTNSSAGGHDWNLISSGSGNTEGAGKLLFRDRTTEAVRMTLDGSGNVGINTVFPTSALEVNGTVKATSFVGSGAGLTGISIPDGSVTSTKLASDRLSLAKVSAGALTTDATGNVGIGNASPASALDVNGTVTATTLASTLLTGGQQPDIYLSGRTVTVHAGDVNAAPWWAVPGGDLVLQGGNGYNADFNDPLYHGGNVVLRSGANFIQAIDPALDGGDIVFQTGGATNSFVERARVLGRNGNVGIGTASPQAKLEVAGDIKSNNKSVTVGEQSLRIVQGIVPYYTQTSGSGPGFTWSQSALGQVQITFTTPFSDRPAITATVGLINPGDAESSHCYIAFDDSAVPQIAVRGSNGLGIRRDFFFIAVGPR